MREKNPLNSQSEENNLNLHNMATQETFHD